MTEELIAYYHQQKVGILIWDRKKDLLQFNYTDTWRTNPQAFPLSLSMPLVIQSHPHEKIEPFIWGLLPDSESTLVMWAKRFGVSSRNAFRILAYVGEDCAGAIQFVVPEKESEWLSKAHENTVKWLTKKEVSERIDLLLKDHSATRKSDDPGYFSLAGAQPKLALQYDETKSTWGIPSGIAPTTHILKPATGDYQGFAENEHFCLSLAKELGMKTAESYVEEFDGQSVFVVKRYDRLKHDESILRIHQEDFCQALAISPKIKYQNEGGPDATQIIDLLRNYSSDVGTDIWRFTEAMMLNWIIVGTDAHAKNYSIMLAAKGQARLAPLYDIISFLPYSDAHGLKKIKMAMKIGGRYKVEDISAMRWLDFANENRLPSDELLNKLETMIHNIPDAINRANDQMEATNITHPIIDQLNKCILQRSEYCIESIQSARKASNS